ncbi:hypothetical protein B0H13DRAFT_1872232 [Mycena leptocephala]|nr:hypothetical protein B0H13DRAFT_1872232 [Mycena leptocephala]
MSKMTSEDAHMRGRKAGLSDEFYRGIRVGAATCRQSQWRRYVRRPCKIPPVQKQITVPATWEARNAPSGHTESIRQRIWNGGPREGRGTVFEDWEMEAQRLELGVLRDEGMSKQNIASHRELQDGEWMRGNQRKLAVGVVIDSREEKDAHLTSCIFGGPGAKFLSVILARVVDPVYRLSGPPAPMFRLRNATPAHLEKPTDPFQASALAREAPKPIRYYLAILPFSNLLTAWWQRCAAGNWNSRAKPAQIEIELALLLTFPLIISPFSSLKYRHPYMESTASVKHCLHPFPIPLRYSPFNTVLGGCLSDPRVPSSELGKHQGQGRCHSQCKFVHLQVKFKLKVAVRRPIQHQTGIKLQVYASPGLKSFQLTSIKLNDYAKPGPKFESRLNTSRDANNSNNASCAYAMDLHGPPLHHVTFCVFTTRRACILTFVFVTICGSTATHNSRDIGDPATVLQHLWFSLNSCAAAADISEIEKDFPKFISVGIFWLPVNMCAAPHHALDPAHVGVSYARLHPYVES